DRRLEARIVGVLPEYLAMNGLRIADGRFINQVDNERFDNVAVLGAETAEVLFPLESPMGATVFVDNRFYFRVIGVTERRAPSGNIGSSFSGQDYNRDIYIPFQTDRVRFGTLLFYFKAGTFKYEKLEISQVTIEVDEMAHVRRTADLIRGTLE